MEKEIVIEHKLVDHQPIAVRSLVVVPVVKEDRPQENMPSRSISARVEEALGLARAIDLDVIVQQTVTLSQVKPATLLGSGKVDELGEIIFDNEIGLAIVDYSLTPVQQRNLEKAWNCKVIDRTGLILEIFGERARTREGTLQVELAHLNYQKGRLVRSWTHLERQRGGGGFLGGPGETQIEADRRLLQDKITRLKRDLEKVVKTRELHRAKRKKTPHPVVALVGYTNAGKSTLFNRITGADVLAKDMLFATLDPTLRRIKFPHGDTVILSDTVGFISNLPTHLVAAFRATLEEVIEADIILHVRDMSDPDNAVHRQDVLDILKGLGVEVDDPERMIEVWNKVDRLEQAAQEQLQQTAQTAILPSIPLSAIDGTGIDELTTLIEQRISGKIERISLQLNSNELVLLDWLYRNGRNHQRKDREDGSVKISVDLSSSAYEAFKIRRERLNLS
ncbi:GTPase HflX [Bartonella sp. HY329]|uniref:GTPase HflX n=1 Tax=unclassified Bartonella TaxID=2645622 RepID=UPI0021C69976|nr:MULTISPECIES: GTPase HflX [unclassified Bartonella]UXM94089.1 GTPase HflX [Bartonella sp. HY329]UXN08411.1 GTPase HflX [Bartonella sp. HY328]